MSIIETIQIDEDNRITVEVDQWSDSPLDWGWDVEMHDIDNYRTWAFGETSDCTIAQVAGELHARLGKDNAKTERALRLYLHLIGDECEVAVHDFAGHSKSHWATVLEIGNDGSMGLYTAYAAWRRGDVYIVTHEKREQWTNSTETAEMDTWEYFDSIGGCYLDDEYTALTVASEYFDLVIDELDK